MTAKARVASAKRSPRSISPIKAPDTDLAPNRRRSILLAAERLFASKGFHGVSIRDIADEAGVPLALVGYYFGPKAELYQRAADLEIHGRSGMSRKELEEAVAEARAAWTLMFCRKVLRASGGSPQWRT